MSELNGKPPPDINLLTPNDYRRLRVALGGRDPRELLSGEVEDVLQCLTWAYKLREDPSFTWEAAGDIAPGEMFDMTAGREPDPQMPTPTAAGTARGTSGGPSSKRKPSSSTSAPPSAPTSASPAPSTTS